MNQFAHSEGDWDAAALDLFLTTAFLSIWNIIEYLKSDNIFGFNLEFGKAIAISLKHKA